MSANRTSQRDTGSAQTGPFDDVIPESGESSGSEKRRTIRTSSGGRASRESRKPLLRSTDSSEESKVEDKEDKEPRQSKATQEDSQEPQDPSEQPDKDTSKHSEEFEHTASSSEQKRERVAVELPERHRNALDDIKLYLKRVEKLPARDASYNRIIAHALERYYEEIFPGHNLESMD